MIAFPLRSRPRVRVGSDEGFAAPEFAVGVALILVPVMLVVLSLPTWWERQSLARLAAHEAARTVVMSRDVATGTTAATAVVTQIAANHDIPASDVSVTYAGTLARGASVSATVTVTVPAVSVAPYAKIGSFSLSHTATELVDAYRSLPS